jgi:hypothetical protein
MSLPTPQWTINNDLRFPNYDRILAPVPLRRNQPTPGYYNMVSRIDGTLGQGSWNCSCANSFGPATGIQDAANAFVNGGTVQGGAFYNELSCAGVRKGCVDPNALTYDPSVQVGDQLSCIYATATANQDCNSARAPANGCQRLAL